MTSVRFSALSLSISLGLAIGFAGCGGGGSENSCDPGEPLCPCPTGLCYGGLICVNGFCLFGDDETSGDGDSNGDGDGDTNGDGDGDTNGDGDGDTNGDGDGDTNGDGDGDAGDGDGDPCMAEEYPATYEPPAVMFVVDTSGSMVGTPWDHDLNVNTPNVTRWNSLVSAIQTTMNNYGDSVLAGIQRFPAASACDPHPCYNATACTTLTTPEEGIAPNNGAGILAAIPAANATSTDIEGGTPTTKGIESARDHLLDAASDIPRAIVLVTDGAANCNTDLPFPDYIEEYDETLPLVVEDAYLTYDIPTYVIGILIVDMLLGVGAEGSAEANPWDRLNDVALAGGTALPGVEKFYNAGSLSELVSSMDDIFASMTDCTIDLSQLPDGLPPLDQVPFVDIELGGSPLPYVASCLDGDGWTWIEEGVVAEICGSDCDQFASGDSVSVVYGCG